MKMKHMGQLWLTAEVRDLESRVRGKTALSPYLVIDADALIIHTPMVKQLVYSRKFIVLVPSAGMFLHQKLLLTFPEGQWNVLFAIVPMKNKNNFNFYFKYITNLNMQHALIKDL